MKSGIKSQDYYNTDGKRTVDFFLGVIGTYIFLFFWIFLINLISIMIRLNTFSSIIIGYIIPIIILIVTASFMKRNRRFISIGIISSLILPPLLFGACTLGGFALMR